MTNMEYIQQMKARGLTEFLLDMDNGEINYAKHDCRYCHETDCDECMDWWLGLDTKEPQGLEYEEKKGSHEWISVNDRLPKESGFYLVYMPEWTGYMEVCFYSACYGWKTSDHVYNRDMITYWMPLPKSPEV